MLSIGGEKMTVQQTYNLSAEDKNSVKMTVNSKGRFSLAEVKIYHEDIDKAKESCLRIANELKALILADQK